MVAKFIYFFQNGADDVKRHRWFKGLDWDEVFYRKLKVKKIIIFFYY